MEEVSYKGVFSYDEILPLEVASFGDGAVTKVQFIERTAGPYWTVRVNTALAGFMNAAVRGEQLHIMHVEVAPEFRRRGIARRLLGAARLFAQEADVSHMMLRVRADNEPARPVSQVRLSRNRAPPVPVRMPRGTPRRGNRYPRAKARGRIQISSFLPA